MITLPIMITCKKRKVDLALILASGLGERIAPLTFDIPKCFVKIDNESLIERQINQLQEVGIKDIVIVVGYLSEKFEYLKKKFNVQLVVNDEYKTKGSVWSFKCAIPYIKNKNIYVCCSDIYMKDNIYNLNEKYSHFKGKYIKGKSNEWGFDIDDNDNIIRINKYGNDNYCMVGVAYFNYEDTNLLCDLTDKFLQDSNNHKEYWEEVLLQNISLFENYKIEKLSTDVLFEFDNYNEYFNFPYRGNVTGCPSFKLISKVFNISENDICVLDCVKNGITNRSYIFSIKEDDTKKYLMRVPGVETDKFIDRRLEEIALKKLERFNITEKIVYFDSKYGYKITEFFDNAKCIDINSIIDLKLAMKEIKKFHYLVKDIQIDKNKDIFELIKCHTSIIKDNKFNYPYDDEIYLREKTNLIINGIKEFHRKEYFCHGDANPTNMLKTNDGVKFIDFEYTTMSDPLFEISTFAVNSGFDVDGLLVLLDYYKNADGDNFVIEELTDEAMKTLVIAYYTLFQFYCYLWSITQQHYNSLDYKDILTYYHNKTLEGIDKYFNNSFT